MESQLVAVRSATTAYVEELHATNVLKPIPQELHPYFKFMPELAAVETEVVVHRALKESEEAESQSLAVLSASSILTRLIQR